MSESDEVTNLRGYYKVTENCGTKLLACNEIDASRVITALCVFYLT